MPKPKTETAIPLLCTLCPKNPQFSDVSHLLTHISSKSHLSHRFKLQIRAQSEIAAIRQLDDFDTWYKHNNLDAMLADRLAAKEQKKTAKERKAKMSAGPAKKEKNEFDMEQSLAATPVYRAPIPRMQAWATGNLSTQSSTSEWQPSLYDTPTARRAIPNFAPQETPATNPIDPNLGTPWKPHNDGDTKSEDKLTESMKLKGKQWPGMDLFDSATPEMKRMRNQRKDGTILVQMKATSAEVVPDEIVYNMDGSVSHTRDIFGPPSCETSPYKIELSPKKRKPRTKPALTNLDVNVPRLRTQRAKKTAPFPSPYKRPAAPQRSRSQFGFAGLGFNNIQSNPLAAAQSSYNDEEPDFELGNTKNRGFTIFKDPRDVVLNGASPAGTESPLQDARLDLISTAGLSSYTRKSPRNHGSPTPGAKSSAMRIFGKENNRPEMGSRIQVSRTMTTAVYQPQALQDLMINNHNPLNPNSYGFNQYGQHLSYQVVGSPQGFFSSFQGNFQPLNGPSGSPGYVQNSYAAPPSHSNRMNSRPGSGHGGSSNNMLSGGVGHGSRSGSGYGGTNGHSLYHSNDSRPGSSHSVSNPINIGIYGGNTNGDSRPGSGHGNGSATGMFSGF